MTEEMNNGLASPQDVPEAEQAPVEQDLESATTSEPEEEVKIEKPKGISPDKVQRRFDDITRKRYEAEGRAKALEERAKFAESQLAELTGQSKRQQEAPEVNVEERAREISEQSRFDEKCDAIFNATVKEYPEFGKQWGSIIQHTGLLAKDVVECLLDSDNQPRLLKHLADNPDDAIDLLSLPPRRLARELAMLEVKLAADKPKPSSAPKPISPVKSRSSSSDEPDITDTAKWIAWSRAQDLKKRQ